jgi:hypothetical protein
MCIDSRRSWNGLVSWTEEALKELIFWLKHILELNGQTFVTKQDCSKEVFSDASATGYGGFISGDNGQNCSGSWSDSESEKSYTWTELQAVYKVLPKFAGALRGNNVRWNVDNKNVVSILKGGSMKPDLQKNCGVNFQSS